MSWHIYCTYIHTHIACNDYKPGWLPNRHCMTSNCVADWWVEYYLFSPREKVECHVLQLIVAPLLWCQRWPLYQNVCMCLVKYMHLVYVCYRCLLCWAQLCNVLLLLCIYECDWLCNLMPAVLLTCFSAGWTAQMEWPFQAPERILLHLLPVQAVLSCLSVQEVPLRSWSLFS